ncbi:tyrosine-type recombinase/integrase [Paraburkholderia sp. BR14263]|uniref:tyrosine-type recombinase/integrase n=1 Tax=unclassified Paraburkholderia TaxID=2615204 RepID=UPI0034CD9835
MSSKIKRAAVLAPGQIRHLLRVTEVTSHYPERDAVILLLGFGVGMRISEIAQVTVSDVMYPNGRLRVECSLREAITKGCRQRTVYLTGRTLLEALER